MLYIFISLITMALILAAFWARKKEKATTTVPGLNPISKDLGNMPDIAKAGGLHQFVINLHDQFGPLVSFWYGPQFCVSVSKASHFKEMKFVGERPESVNKFMAPLLTKHAIIFAPGDEGKERNRLYTKAFGFSTSSELLPMMNKIGIDIAKNWHCDQEILLYDSMLKLAIRTITETQCGSYFKNGKVLKIFSDTYQEVMDNLDAILAGKFDQNDKENYQKFQAGLKHFQGMVKSFIQEHCRQRESGDCQKAPFLDVSLDYFGHDDKKVFADASSFIFGGFHSVSNALTWILFFLTKYPDVQEKVAQELKMVTNFKQELTPDMIPKMTFTKQVINESLRFSLTVTTTAKINNEADMSIGGHLIKRGTALIVGIGRCLMDQEYFSTPDRFDPDHFAPENVRKRPTDAFCPFGFGARKCPGREFFYFEACSTISTILSKFKLVPPPDREFGNPSIKFGLVTMPRDPIWIKLEKRI